MVLIPTLKFHDSWIMQAIAGTINLIQCIHSCQNCDWKTHVHHLLIVIHFCALTWICKQTNEPIMNNDIAQPKPWSIATALRITHASVPDLLHQDNAQTTVRSESDSNRCKHHWFCYIWTSLQCSFPSFYGEPKPFLHFLASLNLSFTLLRA